MAFRTLLIKNKCKLEYSLNYLICRKSDEDLRISLDEIKTIVIDSLQVSITTFLICELSKRNIKLIFVDNKHNPIGEVIPYQGNAYSYRHIKEQFSITQDNKDYLWKKIVYEKIKNQSRILEKNKLLEQANLLTKYMSEIELGDSSNREGHSAKVYFNALFGNKFSRDLDCPTNKYLNYGYSIILSSINREVVVHGFLPEIGIHHIGESNPFNLSCDLMEPLRQMVDNLVVDCVLNDENYIDSFVSILQQKVQYDNKEMILENAIHLYVEDLMNYLLSNNEEKIKFIEYGI